MRSLIIFHSADFDGLASAAIANKFVSGYKHSKGEKVFHGMNYGDEFPWEEAEQCDYIYMMDFALQPFSDMIKLAAMPAKFIWIDHHKSSIENNAEFHGDDFIDTVILDTKQSGCELTWAYFSNKQLPAAVLMLGRYDIWDKGRSDWEEMILPFQYGMRSRIFSYDAREWEILLSDDALALLKRIGDDGLTIMQYEKVQSAKYINAYAYETSLNGHKALAVNKGFTNSQLFEGYDGYEDYDLWITHIMMPNGKWTVSLYSQTVDCSAIAKLYGGGGHKGASGFQCNQLPFVPITISEDF